MTTAAWAGPLSGVRVIEVGTNIMAPFAGQMLGDLGADVVKLETAEGDPNRSLAPGVHPELSGLALNLHRNKRSIAVNLKEAEGRTVAHKLIATADVFVSNMRPSAQRRIALDYGTLSGLRPDLVYVEAHGFRIDSGLAEVPSYDDTIQAACGLPRLNEPVAGDVFFPPTLIADKVAAMNIVQAVLAGLYRRATSGEGQRIEVPMFDSVLAFVLAEHMSRGAMPGGAAGYGRILTANRGPHQTSDGWLAIMPFLDRHWETLFAEAGCAGLLESPWQADMRARLLNSDQAYGDLKTAMLHRTTAEWLETCDRHDIPVAEVPTLDEILADEARHHGAIRLTEHPVVGTYRDIRPPLVFHGSPGAASPRPAPLTGQDTAHLMGTLGYSPEDVADLHARGVVRARIDG
jgi:crotonobetainyl-CoA:carnitine CoA-transferase CaiB-like acyl-CoA transferase